MNSHIATALILLSIFDTVAFSGETTFQATSSPEDNTITRLTDNKWAIGKLLEIPAPKNPIPDPDRKWRNPVILLDSYGIHVNGSQISIEDLLNTLAGIPRSGWPNGRVIELIPYPGLSSDLSPGRFTKAEVLILLKSADIEVVYNMSSA